MAGHRRGLSTPELGDGQIARVCRTPRLLMHDDGTGLVVEFVPAGEEWQVNKEPWGDENRPSPPRELPQALATACQKLLDVARALGPSLRGNCKHVGLALVVFAAFTFLLLLRPLAAGTKQQIMIRSIGPMPL
eukprot:evm.model.scf_335EXC.8 EVM.evm.TU.scf_335EXC.8   scf_335EXC:42065-44294(+)